MKCKSSVGYDGISSSFVKDLKEHLASPLEIFLNKSLATGIVPDLILAKIIPIYKSKNRAYLNHYRPIYIL